MIKPENTLLSTKGNFLKVFIEALIEGNSFKEYDTPALVIKGNLSLIQTIKNTPFLKDLEPGIAGNVGLILANLHLFKTIFGLDKTIDFIESRIQWINTDTVYTESNINSILIEIEIELLQLSLGKSKCIPLKSTIELLNASVYVYLNALNKL